MWVWNERKTQYYWVGLTLNSLFNLTYILLELLNVSKVHILVIIIYKICGNCKKIRYLVNHGFVRHNVFLKNNHYIKKSKTTTEGHKIFLKYFWSYIAISYSFLIIKTGLDTMYWTKTDKRPVIWYILRSMNKLVCFAHIFNTRPRNHEAVNWNYCGKISYKLLWSTSKRIYMKLP